MFQIVLQYLSNYILGLSGFGTRFSLLRKFFALHLQSFEIPSCGDSRRLLHFDGMLPTASLKHGYLCDSHLYDRLVANYRGFAKRLGLLNGEHISVCRDLKQFASTRLCVAKRLVTMFSQCAYGALNFVAEYLTSLNGLRHNYLLNTARLCRRSVSKFPAFCVP